MTSCGFSAPSQIYCECSLLVSSSFKISLRHRYAVLRFVIGTYRPTNQDGALVTLTILQSLGLCGSGFSPGYLHIDGSSVVVVVVVVVVAVVVVVVVEPLHSSMLYLLVQARV